MPQPEVLHLALQVALGPRPQVQQAKLPVGVQNEHGLRALGSFCVRSREYHGSLLRRRAGRHHQELLAHRRGPGRRDPFRRPPLVFLYFQCQHIEGVLPVRQHKNVISLAVESVHRLREGMFAHQSLGVEVVARIYVQLSMRHSGCFREIPPVHTYTSIRRVTRHDDRYVRPTPQPAYVMTLQRRFLIVVENTPRVIPLPVESETPFTAHSDVTAGAAGCQAQWPVLSHVLGRRENVGHFRSARLRHCHA